MLNEMNARLKDVNTNLSQISAEIQNINNQMQQLTSRKSQAESSMQVHYGAKQELEGWINKIQSEASKNAPAPVAANDNGTLLD